LLTLIPSKIRKEGEGLSGIHRKFPEILRLFLFTSTRERADTPVSPERKPAGLQTEEAKAETDCGRPEEAKGQDLSVAVTPKGGAAKRSEPAGFDPGKQEGFGLTVTRGRVASGA
jgi:hypothetical protein